VKETGEVMELPNSLAKWKRWALAEYGHKHGEGIWTDMNATRSDEVQDNLHSIYVDQWDWERVISVQERTEDFLRGIVHKIYGAIKKTEMMVYEDFDIAPILPEDIGFVSTLELEERHPGLSRKEREDVAAKAMGAVFVMKIGWPLSDGQPHDGRAPDYDDWNLNGDIIVWNPVLEAAFELSSMGIRVDKEALVKQLEYAKATERLQLEFHRMLMEDRLPLSVGGGIGQSRLCMFLLRKAHIGEVHSSQAWPREMVEELARNGIKLL
jgi:aspartate--ammonia ligase